MLTAEVDAQVQGIPWKRSFRRIFPGLLLCVESLRELEDGLIKSTASYEDSVTLYRLK